MGTCRHAAALVQKLSFGTLALVALEVAVRAELPSVGGTNQSAILRALVGKLTEAFSIHTAFPWVTKNFRTGLVRVFVAYAFFYEVSVLPNWLSRPNLWKWLFCRVRCWVLQGTK